MGSFSLMGLFIELPLQQEYIGISEKKLLKQPKLVVILYEKIVSQENQNQVLVFVPQEGHIENGKATRLGA